MANKLNALPRQPTLMAQVVALQKEVTTLSASRAQAVLDMEMAQGLLFDAEQALMAKQVRVARLAGHCARFAADIARPNIR